MAEGARSSRAVNACFCSHVDVCEPRGSQANDKPLSLAMGDAVNECEMKWIKPRNTECLEKVRSAELYVQCSSPSEHDKEKLRPFPWVLGVLSIAGLAASFR